MKERLRKNKKEISGLVIVALSLLCAFNIIGPGMALMAIFNEASIEVHAYRDDAEINVWVEVFRYDTSEFIGGDTTPFVMSVPAFSDQYTSYILVAEWGISVQSKTVGVLTQHHLPVNFDFTFSSRYSLEIFAADYLQTTPAPGTYYYDPGTSVTVTASPKEGYQFSFWWLSARDRDVPTELQTLDTEQVTVLMDRNWVLTGHGSTPSGNGDDDGGDGDDTGIAINQLLGATGVIVGLFLMKDWFPQRRR